MRWSLRRTALAGGLRDGWEEGLGPSRGGDERAERLARRRWNPDSPSGSAATVDLQVALRRGDTALAGR
jgi:hypothetical protein